ncbi:hypothetical protein RIF29_31668 [Crotalaria pallida]|uniref:Transcription repressor n=1 Tax=Crotalaria pallida TaxID=3830 RepID=A0AAN9EHG8_CROPI
MSSNKKSFLRTVFTSNGSCGCGKTKPFEVHEPIPKPKLSIHHQQNTNPSCLSSSTTTSGDRNAGLSSMEDEDFTSAATSEADTNNTTHHDLDHNNNNDVGAKRSPLIDSVAIEKNSSDPYHDFRHSMLQMIFEKEIDSEEDLQDLLQCFLQLNAPRYHHVIVEAFNDICEEAAFSDKVSSTAETSTSTMNHIMDGKGK